MRAAGRVAWSLCLFACAAFAAMTGNFEDRDELAEQALEHFGGER